MWIYFIKFGNADLIKKSRLFIRVPEELHIKTDIKLVKEYTVQQIKSIICCCKNEPFELTQLKELLKLTFVRVLTFSARR